LILHWEKLRETWMSIREAGHGASVDHAVPPMAIEEEWRTASSLVETLGVDKAQKNDRFVDAFTRILEYWGRTARNGIFGRMTELIQRLDPTSRYTNRFQEWAAKIGETLLTREIRVSAWDGRNASLLGDAHERRASRLSAPV
jgi:hypothetical protein